MGSHRHTRAMTRSTSFFVARMMTFAPADMITSSTITRQKLG